MACGNKITAKFIILLLLSVLPSGCTGEQKSVTQESTHREAVESLTQSSKEENMPEISIASFSSIYMHDNSDNKDIYLFTWENVPGNESHRLLSFLKDNLGINWVENAQISRTEENKTIHVFSAEKSIEIMLNNETAALNISEDYGYYYLLAKEENGAHIIYNNKWQNKYDISERYYAAYSLSIKNNGSGPLYFKLDGLHLHEGDRIFNVTPLELYDKNSSLLEVLQDLEKENKLQDATLLPGETLNGTAAFRVNSLYNESFLLMYNSTPVTSALFDKSIEALRAAEGFNYSVASGMPPYSNVTERGGMKGSYEPDFENYEYWANWMNRSIFETFQKSDVDRMRKSQPESITGTKMIYALRVFPEKNITMFPVTTRFLYYSDLIVIDDAGKEIINKSGIDAMAVLYNQTYIFKPHWKLNFPGMNFSNASVVQISFEGTFGVPTGERLSFVNQDAILDDELNIIVVRYNRRQFVS